MKSAETKAVLRIALDEAASLAYREMISELKKQNAHIKLNPSRFVSFLVEEFRKKYFSKESGGLVAEFFDAQSFYLSQTGKLKGTSDFEAVMSGALAEIRRIKGKARKTEPCSKTEATSDEIL